MERALLSLLLLLIVGVLGSVFVRQARPLIVVLVSILIYLPSYFVWFTIQYLHILPVDSLLHWAFGVESYQLVGTPLGMLAMFGPPLLPSIVILVWFFLIRGHPA